LAAHFAATRSDGGGRTGVSNFLLIETQATETHRQRPPVSGLLIALPTSAIVVVAYAWWCRHDAVPRPGSVVGLALGVSGFLLMLAAETLYTLRKRLPKFHYGRMAAWLQGHIFAGIVGPVLVLLHGAGKFHGLAGVTAALTLTMVVSGFVGRYLYTAIPRSHDGAEIGLQGLFTRSAEVERRLQSLGVQLPPNVASLWNAPPPAANWRLVLLRSWLVRRQCRRVRQAVYGWKSVGPKAAVEVRRLMERRYRLQIEVQSLATLRRLSALWHAAHVPLGIVLFTLAVVHVAAALYYRPW
jgi:hypothetical protein